MPVILKRVAFFNAGVIHMYIYIYVIYHIQNWRVPTAVGNFPLKEAPGREPVLQLITFDRLGSKGDPFAEKTGSDLASPCLGQMG